MNQHWTVRLNDVAEINPKAPKGIGADTDVAFVPMAAVSEDGHLGEHVTRPYSEVSKGYSYFERGDLLLAKITPCFENGKAALVDNLAEQIGFGSTEFHVLRPGPDLDAKYLFYMLWNERFRAEASKAMTGSAGQKRVPADLLRRTELRLPPLDEQRRIAAILDKANALRQKRKRAIALLDSLTQSIFLEMFGEPGDLTSATKQKPLGRVAQLINGDRSSNYPSGSDLISSGVLFLNTTNVTRDGLDLGNANYISEQKFASLSRGKLNPMDIVITLRGSLGQTAIFEDAGPTGFINAQMMIIRASNEIDPRYLLQTLQLDSTVARLKRIGTGSAVPQLTAKQMSELLIPVPELEKQRMFAKRKGAVINVRAAAARKSLAADQLFTSLQHRAFSGQL